MAFARGETARLHSGRRFTKSLLAALCGAMLLSVSGSHSRAGDDELPSGMWQLSVINGGQPRGAASQTPPALSAAEAERLAWPTDASPLNVADWKQQLGSILPVRVHRATFGPAGGWALAGDFNGDAYSEMAVYHQGHWWIDLNGNGRWDDGDLWAYLGDAQSIPVVGDWDGDGKTDIGVFGPARPDLVQTALADAGLPHPRNNVLGQRKNTAAGDDAPRRHLRHTALGSLRSHPVEHIFLFGHWGDLPVVGDWSQTGSDSIGVFRDGVWLLDLDGDGRQGPADARIDLGQPGDLPVVGDFNGDGVVTLGVYRHGRWLIDADGDHHLGPGDRAFELGSPGERPVVGDWDGDGRDQAGVYQP